MKIFPQRPLARRFPWTGALTLLVSLAAAAPSARAEVEAIPGPPPVAKPPAPLFVKVDHFVATSPDAKELFLFFRDTLGLAPVWPFRSYGDFASGAVSLGNVAFEIATWRVPAGEVLPTEFLAFAFEPVGNTAATVDELARRGVNHENPEVTVVKGTFSHDVGWTNTGLTGLVPPEAAFVCDYTDRKQVADGRESARAELAKRQGGPLGVLALKEIVVGVPDVAAASRGWRKLIDSPAAESGHSFGFGTGPRIHLVRSRTPGILRIVIQVRSLGIANAWLASQGLLEDQPGGTVAIARTATKGLHIVLVEQ